jgi:hypothetical protein
LEATIYRSRTVDCFTAVGARSGIDTVWPIAHDILKGGGVADAHYLDARSAGWPANTSQPIP